MTVARVLIVVCVVASAIGRASAQGIGPPAGDPPNTPPAVAAGPAATKLVPLEGINPVTMLDSAMGAFSRSPEPPQAPEARRASSGSSGPGLSAAVNILVLLTVISLAPSIVLMTTCFMRISIVLGLLKQALGAQGVPPPQVLFSLALFMTFLVMAPTVERIHRDAIVPYQQGAIVDHEQLWNAAKQPLRDFMFDQIEATGNWSSLYMVLNYRGIDTSEPEKLTRADVDLVSLVPAYMISELKVAFLMGFRVYLPFLVIDMVVSSLLISMSMMMLPPVLISLPFKILLFVLVDGWQLIVGNLMSSFAQRGDAGGASEVAMKILSGQWGGWGSFGGFVT
jgi:flagellar biosynthetic protein FliP